MKLPDFIDKTIVRDDNFEFFCMPEDDGNGLLLTTLTPCPDSKPGDCQEMLAVVRRATLGQAEYYKILFEDGQLPSRSNTTDSNPGQSQLYDLALNEQVILTRTINDSTALLVERQNDGFWISHLNRDGVESGVAEGVSHKIAIRLISDYKSGVWLELGEDVFPDGDPSIVG